MKRVRIVSLNDTSYLLTIKHLFEQDGQLKFLDENGAQIAMFRLDAIAGWVIEAEDK